MASGPAKSFTEWRELSVNLFGGPEAIKNQNMDDLGWLGHNDGDPVDYWHMIQKSRFCFCTLGLGRRWRTRQYFWVQVGLHMLDSFLWESCDSIIWLAPTWFYHKWAKVIDSIIWV